MCLIHKRTPTFSDSTNILIEASDESNVTRAGLSGDTRVWHTPGTSLLYDRPVIRETHTWIKRAYSIYTLNTLQLQHCTSTTTDIRKELNCIHTYCYLYYINYHIHTHTHCFSALYRSSNLKYGALDEPLGSRLKRLSALSPSATINTSLEAGGVRDVAWGVMPWTRGEVK